MKNRFVILSAAILTGGILSLAATAVLQDVKLLQDQVTPEPAPAETKNMYTVQRGDTLKKIADKVGINQYTLAAVNHITNINKLSLKELELRTLNLEEVQYVIDIVTANDVENVEERKKIAQAIYDSSVKHNIDPMIVLGISGVESDWNPYVFALYVELPRKSNLPPRFKTLQEYAVVAYNCRNPSKYRPDIGMMQISYSSSKAMLTLGQNDTCRLHYDVVFNIQQGVRLLAMKYNKFHNKITDWYVTYHSADPQYTKEYRLKLNKKFYKIYKLLLERE
jgi:LysM repeat protein